MARPKNAVKKDNVEKIAPPNNLQFYRKSALLTQRELAKKANMSRQAIQNLENQNARPYSRTIRQLAEALNVSPQLLFPHVFDALNALQNDDEDITAKRAAVRPPVAPPPSSSKENFSCVA